MTEPAPSTISDEIAAFLGQGLSFLVGTCDATLLPECMRAVGLQVHPDRRHVTVYLPSVTSERTLANLAVSPRIAVVASYPIDHRSLQLKGPVTRIAPAPPEAQAFIAQYLESFSSVLEVVGMPPEVVRLVSHWPSMAVELAVEALFDQTPGPGAGARLVGQAAV